MLRMKKILNLRKRTILIFCFLIILSAFGVSRAIAQVINQDFSENILISSDLDGPSTMAFLPDGRLLINELGGQIRMYTGGVLQSEPVYTAQVGFEGEQGLLGLAIDPNFSLNSYIYIYYTALFPEPHNRVSRLTLAGNSFVLGSEKILLDMSPQGNQIHNGGTINFGKDGKLYISVGDHGNSGNAQSLSNPFGKILRINSDGSIPGDNPFVGVSGARGEIWAYGLRNPFKFSVDPITGSIYVNDVGQNTWEEINLLQRGANYGWPTCEGSCSTVGFVSPIHAYVHNGNASITGSVFYRGSQFPADYYGKYFFSDYNSNWVKVLNSNNTSSDFQINIPTPIDMKISPEGSLYVLSIYPGRLTEVRYTKSNQNHPPIVSIGGTPTNGLAPLIVQFSASGSDVDGDSLSYSWSFGDESNGSGQNVSHTYTRPGRYTAQVTASDGKGGVASEAILVTVGSSPISTINTPISGAKYKAGDLISYSGNGIDSFGLTIPSSAFSWKIIFHHGTHVHPFLGPINGVKSGSFSIPTTGETSSDVFYRIELTVTDTNGLQSVATRDVLPIVSNIKIDTNPSGLKINLDGQPFVSPYSFTGVSGMIRNIGVLSPQTINGKDYEFVSWSDAGALNHTITTPSVNSIYTTVFKEKAIVTPPPPPSPTPTPGPTPTPTPSPVPTPTPPPPPSPAPTPSPTPTPPVPSPVPPPAPSPSPIGNVTPWPAPTSWTATSQTSGTTWPQPTSWSSSPTAPGTSWSSPTVWTETSTAGTNAWPQPTAWTSTPLSSASTWAQPTSWTTSPAGAPTSWQVSTWGESGGWQSSAWAAPTPW